MRAQIGSALTLAALFAALSGCGTQNKQSTEDLGKAQQTLPPLGGGAGGGIGGGVGGGTGGCEVDSDCAPQQCKTARCNAQTGACSYSAVAVNTPCEDGNLCTIGDTCQAGGVCTPGTARTCTALDQCHVAGLCDPSSGICSNPTKPNGTTCNDNNLCTTGDSCQAGICTATPVVCTALDQCHAVGTCDLATGQCSNPALANGTTCSDGNACTTGDSCQSGTCTSGTPVVCTAQDDCHGAGTCDTTTGLCSNPALADGTSCGTDGGLCESPGTCTAGVCNGANNVTCTALDQCHIAGVCDNATGICSNPAKADGTPCNDGDPCTFNDTCQNGVCGGTLADGGTPPPPPTDGGTLTDGGVEGPFPTRTLGFFKTHESALQQCLDLGSVDLGLISVSSLNDALGILWAQPNRFSNNTARSSWDRDALLLMRQLLTATCNERLFGGSPPLSNALAALNGTDCTAILDAAAALDAYNNSNDSLALPAGFNAGPATPIDAKTKATDPTAPTSNTCGGMP